MSTILPLVVVSRAGTPPADLIYALAFSRVLSKFNDALEAKGLRSSVSAHRGPPVLLSDVDYCDDAVIPVVAPASGIVSKCVDVVYVACCVFSSFGLQLNFDKNKTNAMARFVGKDAVAARRELYLKGSCVEFDFYGKWVSLQFVDSYKHMGTNFSMSHDLAQEVVVRAAIIRSGVRALKPVLANSRLPLKRKLSFVKAHLFSSGLFQCST